MNFLPIIKSLRVMSLVKNLITLLLATTLIACASGSSIVTGIKKTPLTPNQVKLYTELPTKKYEVIGVVSASSDAGWTEQNSVDYAVEELKIQAAKLGANGVLLGATGETTSTIVGGYGSRYTYLIPVVSKTISGKAIYIKRQQ